MFNLTFQDLNNAWSSFYFRSKVVQNQNNIGIEKVWLRFSAAVKKKYT